MKTAFNNRFNQLETKRKRLLEQLQLYPEEIINKKINPQNWSIAEVLKHLIAADEASLHYLQKKILGVATTEKSGLRGKWRLFTLKVAFVLPLKFKAPTATTPSSGLVTLKELTEKWDSIKMETLLLLNNLNDEDFKKNIWNHPVVGKMNVLQMIDFTGMHFDRHHQQIKNVLKIVATNF